MRIVLAKLPRAPRTPVASVPARPIMMTGCLVELPRAASNCSSNERSTSRKYFCSQDNTPLCARARLDCWAATASYSAAHAGALGAAWRTASLQARSSRSHAPRAAPTSPTTAQSMMSGELRNVLHSLTWQHCQRSRNTTMHADCSPPSRARVRTPSRSTSSRPVWRYASRVDTRTNE